MKEPPADKPYKLLKIYGDILASVATQQTPMVVNPRMPMPERKKKTSDVIFKVVGGVIANLPLL